MPEPINFQQQIETLRRRAARSGVKEPWLTQYATLLLAARESVRTQERARASTDERLALAVGYPFGFRPGDQISLKDVEARYRASRMAQRQVHASAAQALPHLRRFHEILSQNVAGLGEARQIEKIVVQIADTIRTVENLERATAPEQNVIEAFVQLQNRTDARRPGLNHVTLLWWNAHIPKYRGKWRHMQALAYTWNVSKISDAANFRRYVLGLLQELRERGRVVEGCPHWAASLLTYTETPKTR